MIATDVTLNHYRSWARLSVQPHPRLNLVHGGNAQGKSNLLEALYALVTTRPYRAQKEVEVIRFGEEYGHVHATFQGSDRQVSCEIVWQRPVGGGRPRKEIKVNRQPVQRLVDVFGVARGVLFTPRDLDLVQGAPELRRRYLDVLLCQLHPVHLYALSQYQRVVQERNRFLRAAATGGGGRGDDAAMHEVWTEQLVRWGASLMERRRASLERLAPLVERIYRHLSGASDSVDLRYLPSVESAPGEPTAEALAGAFARRAREERARGMTLCGPHRDDVAILLDGRPLRAFGSQGQTRCAALAMRLAEGEMLEREGLEAPLLLLDDCLSEIDPRRQDALWSYLEGRGQIFLTTATWDGRPLPIPGRMLHVAGGSLELREPEECCA